MKKKTLKREKKRCQRLLKPWIRALGLDYWEYEFIYYRDETDYQYDTNTSGNGIAVVWVQWEYLRFKVAINVPMIRHMSDDRLRRVLVHELCHVLVEETKEPDENNKHNERVVTNLQKVLFWVKAAAERGKLAI